MPSKYSESALLHAGDVPLLAATPATTADSFALRRFRRVYAHLGPNNRIQKKLILVGESGQQRICYELGRKRHELPRTILKQAPIQHGQAVKDALGRGDNRRGFSEGDATFLRNMLNQRRSIDLRSEVSLLRAMRKYLDQGSKGGVYHCGKLRR
ncbi:MAG: hypothetical protein WBO88_10920 [Candidatus Dechloromonas phosphoritropha]